MMERAGPYVAKDSFKCTLQAFVSFVGECPDAEMLEDVLSALEAALRHGSLTHKPLVTPHTPFLSPEVALLVRGNPTPMRSCITLRLAVCV